VYFSEDYGRGDVHLRACIQDVVPSTLGRLRDLGRSEAYTALALLRDLLPGMSEKQAAYLPLMPCWRWRAGLLVPAYR
jgi:hypothetical protein